MYASEDEAAEAGDCQRYTWRALLAAACLGVVWVVSGASVGASDGFKIGALGRAPLCRPGAPPPDCALAPGCVYVLRLQNNTQYVGHTTRAIEKRMREHFGPKGSQWTALHRPVCVESVAPGDTTAENRETLSRMCRYGINQVRGGCWAGIRYKPRFDPCGRPTDLSVAAQCPRMLKRPRA